MHTFGVTSEDFGRAVVQLRAYAATNPNAYFYGRPITLEDHQASRWIAEPSIRLFDCCQETDGAVALVVTAADRAADTRAPVVIEVAAGASPGSLWRRCRQRQHGRRAAVDGGPDWADGAIARGGGS